MYVNAFGKHHICLLSIKSKFKILALHCRVKNSVPIRNLGCVFLHARPRRCQRPRYDYQRSRQNGDYNFVRDEIFSLIDLTKNAFKCSRVPKQCDYKFSLTNIRQNIKLG